MTIVGEEPEVISKTLDFLFPMSIIVNNTFYLAVNNSQALYDTIITRSNMYQDTTPLDLYCGLENQEGIELCCNRFVEAYNMSSHL